MSASAFPKARGLVSRPRADAGRPASAAGSLGVPGAAPRGGGDVDSLDLLLAGTGGPPPRWVHQWVLKLVI